MSPERTPHVAFFVPTMCGGGAERVIRNLAVDYHSRGFEVDLVLVHRTGPYLDGLPAGIRVVDLGGHRILASLPSLVAYLRRSRPDTLLATITEANLVALWATALARVSTRVVIRIANTPSKSLARMTGFSGVVVPHLLTYWYPKADHIVTVSAGVEEDLRETFGIDGRLVTPIPNPKRISHIQELASRPLAAAWLRTSEPIVLGVGRLVEQKDYPTLIRAFARLRADRPARLVIVGEGPERPVLESLVRSLGLDEHVWLPGFVENPFAYMAAAAVLALSSKWEGAPNVLVEAMACGTPVVATDCPSGPAEILADGAYGTLVPVGDVEGLCDGIAATLASRPPRDRLVARAEAFSIDRVVPAYDSVLFPDREIATERRPSDPIDR